MRAVLVVNPAATTTSDAMRDVIAAALSSSLDLEVVHTTSRNDAVDIARQAATDSVDILLALGGDGTVNELANGLMSNGPCLDGPVLGAIPGGNANVFTRNMGFPADPVEATARILDSIEQERFQTVGVGKVTTPELERHFLFNAGIGLDAAVLARMEKRRTQGKSASDASYAALALNELFLKTDRRHPSLTITGSQGQELHEAHLALIVNIAPWSYLGARPLNPTPQANLNTALDVYAPTRLSGIGVARLARSILRSVAEPRDVITLHDQPRVQFSTARPLWVQVDGEALGETTSMVVTHIPDALKVMV